MIAVATLKGDVMLDITVYTILIIQNNGNDVTTSFGKDPKTEKWRGFIHLYRGGRFDSEVLSTKPIFDSSQQAEQHMKDLIKKIRKLNLSDIPSDDPKSERKNIPTNECLACGHIWETFQQNEICPRCDGHGKPNPKCTCKYCTGAFGIKINVIAKRNPECPVHSSSTVT